MNETTVSGSIAAGPAVGLGTQRRVQEEDSDDGTKAPDAPKAKEFGLWKNSVLAGAEQRDKKKSKKVAESKSEERNEMDTPAVQSGLKKMAARHNNENWTKEQLADLGRRLASVKTTRKNGYTEFNGIDKAIIRSKKVNELDCGSGQRQLKLAEENISEEQLLAKELARRLDLFMKGLDRDLGKKSSDRGIQSKTEPSTGAMREDNKSIGPDKNDPFEKGWRARYDDSNPYEKGTKEYNEWQNGKDEREAQPNHYDESVTEQYDPATAIMWINQVSQLAHAVSQMSPEELVKLNDAYQSFYKVAGGAVAGGAATGIGGMFYSLMKDTLSAAKSKARVDTEEIIQLQRQIVSIHKRLKTLKSEPAIAKYQAMLKQAYEVLEELESRQGNQVAEEGKGLWANIHAKQNRIKNGSGEHMRKPGSKGAPTKANFKSASKTEDVSEDSDPCWSDYKQVGMKKKNGKKVPNCVPKEGVAEEQLDEHGDPWEDPNYDPRGGGETRSPEQIAKDNAEHAILSKKLGLKNTNKLPDIKDDMLKMMNHFMGQHSKKKDVDEASASSSRSRAGLAKLSKLKSMTLDQQKEYLKKQLEISDKRRQARDDKQRAEYDKKMALKSQLKDKDDAKKGVTEATGYKSQFPSAAPAIQYAKDKVKTFRDPDDGIEIWSMPDGGCDVVHTSNSNGRNHCIDNRGKKLGTIRSQKQVKETSNYGDLDEVAPPHEEKLVKKLKKEYPGHPEKAFATAWSIHNKKHGKK